MKILHISDLHFCKKHIKWCRKAMDAAIMLAANEKIDAWVISGDSFDATMPVHEPSVADYASRVQRLADIAPGLVLYGTASHDHPGALDFVRTIGGTYPILLADRPMQWVLGNNRWRIHAEGSALNEGVDKALFSVMPSLNKADPEVMSDPRAWVQKHMMEWARANAGARELGMPTVLVTHGTVTGCETESRHAMVSPDHEFSVATLASCGASATMLGHIHKHQKWVSNTQTIAYAGSMTRLVYGQHDPAGCLLWDVNSTNASFVFHELPSRRLLEITFDGPPDLQKLAHATQDVDEDTSVRVRWDVDQEHAHTVDRAALEQALSAAGEIKLEGSINPVVSVRAKGIGGNMTMKEKLAAYLATTGDEEMTDDLFERYELMMLHRDAGATAENILEAK